MCSDQLLHTKSAKMRQMTSQATPALVPIDGNMVSVLDNLIAELQNAIEGQLLDKGRVIDNLLDLRLAAEDNPAALAAVDALLGSVPGKSVVETSWWREALTGLSDAASPASV